MFPLIIILIGAVIIRLIFFVGLNWCDDPDYVTNAHYISQGHVLKANYVNALRSMMVYPLAFFIRIFGLNNFSIALYPLLCSVGEIVLCYLFASKAFGKRAGIIAAFLMTTYCLDITLATWALPDVPISFFTSLSMYIFFSAQIAKKRNSTEKKENRLSNLPFLIAGIIMGFAYLIKESGIIPLLFFPAYLVYEIMEKKFSHNKSIPKLLWKCVLILIGFLIVFCAEGLFYYALHSDFLNRYHVLNSYFNRENAVELGSLNTDLRFYPSLMFNIDYGGHFMKNNQQMPYGFYYYAFAIAFITILTRFAYEKFRRKTCKKNKPNKKILNKNLQAEELKKRKCTAFFLIWFFTVFLFLHFGSFSITKYSPLHRLDRHLAIVSIPTMVVIAFFVDRLFFYDSSSDNVSSNLKKSNTRVKILKISLKILGVLFILLLGSHSLYMAKNIHSQLKESVKDMESIYLYLKKINSAKTLYADGSTIGFLLFYFKYNPPFRFENIETFSCNSTHNVYVLIDSTRGWFDKAPFYQNLPECVKNIPADWILVEEFTEANKYVYHYFNPKLYYVN